MDPSNHMPVSDKLLVTVGAKSSRGMNKTISRNRSLSNKRPAILVPKQLPLKKDNRNSSSSVDTRKPVLAMKSNVSVHESKSGINGGLQISKFKRRIFLKKAVPTQVADISIDPNSVSKTKNKKRNSNYSTDGLGLSAKIKNLNLKQQGDALYLDDVPSTKEVNVNVGNADNSSSIFRFLKFPRIKGFLTPKTDTSDPQPDNAEQTMYLPDSKPPVSENNIKGVGKVTSATKKSKTNPDCNDCEHKRRTDSKQNIHTNRNKSRVKRAAHSRSVSSIGSHRTLSHTSNKTKSKQTIPVEQLPLPQANTLVAKTNHTSDIHKPRVNICSKPYESCSEDSQTKGLQKMSTKTNNKMNKPTVSQTSNGSKSKQTIQFKLPLPQAQPLVMKTSPGENTISKPCESCSEDLCQTKGIKKVFTKRNNKLSDPHLNHEDGHNIAKENRMHEMLANANKKKILDLNNLTELKQKDINLARQPKPNQTEQCVTLSKSVAKTNAKDNSIQKILVSAKEKTVIDLKGTKEPKQTDVHLVRQSKPKQTEPCENTSESGIKTKANIKIIQKMLVNEKEKKKRDLNSFKKLQETNIYLAKESKPNQTKRYEIRPESVGITTDVNKEKAEPIERKPNKKPPTKSLSNKPAVLNNVNVTDNVTENLTGNVPVNVPENVHENVPVNVPENVHENVTENEMKEQNIPVSNYETLRVQETFKPLLPNMFNPTIPILIKRFPLSGDTSKGNNHESSTTSDKPTASDTAVTEKQTPSRYSSTDDNPLNSNKNGEVIRNERKTTNKLSTLNMDDKKKDHKTSKHTIPNKTLLTDDSTTTLENKQNAKDRTRKCDITDSKKQYNQRRDQRQNKKHNDFTMNEALGDNHDQLSPIVMPTLDANTMMKLAIQARGREYKQHNQCQSAKKSSSSNSDSKSVSNPVVDIRGTGDNIENDASPQRVKVASPQRVKDASPQRVKDASPQRVKDASPLRVKDASPQRVKDASPQGVKVASPQRVKDASPQRVKDASPQRVNDASPQRIKDASLQRVNDVGSQRVTCLADGSKLPHIDAKSQKIPCESDKPPTKQRNKLIYGPLSPPPTTGYFSEEDDLEDDDDDDDEDDELEEFEEEGIGNESPKPEKSSNPAGISRQGSLNNPLSKLRSWFSKEVVPHVSPPIKLPRENLSDQQTFSTELQVIPQLLNYPYIPQTTVKITQGETQRSRRRQERDISRDYSYTKISNSIDDLGFKTGDVKGMREYKERRNTLLNIDQGRTFKYNDVEPSVRLGKDRIKFISKPNYDQDMELDKVDQIDHQSDSKKKMESQSKKPEKSVRKPSKSRFTRIMLCPGDNCQPIKNKSIENEDIKRDSDKIDISVTRSGQDLSSTKSGFSIEISTTKKDSNTKSNSLSKYDRINPGRSESDSSITSDSSYDEYDGDADENENNDVSDEEFDFDLSSSSSKSARKNKPCDEDDTVRAEIKSNNNIFQRTRSLVSSVVKIIPTEITDYFSSDENGNPKKELFGVRRGIKRNINKATGEVERYKRVYSNEIDQISTATSSINQIAQKSGSFIGDSASQIWNSDTVQDYISYDEEGHPKSELFGFRRGVKRNWERAKGEIERSLSPVSSRSTSGPEVLSHDSRSSKSLANIIKDAVVNSPKVKKYFDVDEKGNPKKEVFGFRRGVNDIKAKVVGSPILKDYLTYDNHGNPKKEVFGIRRNCKKLKDDLGSYFMGSDSNISLEDDRHASRLRHVMETDSTDDDDVTKDCHNIYIDNVYTGKRKKRNPRSIHPDVTHGFQNGLKRSAKSSDSEYSRSSTCESDGSTTDSDREAYNDQDIKTFSKSNDVKNDRSTACSDDIQAFHKSGSVFGLIASAFGASKNKYDGTEKPEKSYHSWNQRVNKQNKPLTDVMLEALEEKGDDYDDNSSVETSDSSLSEGDTCNSTIPYHTTKTPNSDLLSTFLNAFKSNYNKHIAVREVSFSSFSELDENSNDTISESENHNGSLGNYAAEQDSESQSENEESEYVSGLDDSVISGPTYPGEEITQAFQAIASCFC